MKTNDALRKAAFAFEYAVRKYTPLTTDGETYQFRKVLDFGTVTTHCVNGKATLWVVFPDKRISHFELAKSGKRLIWVYHKRPNIYHSTLELFRGFSMWWGVVQWLESLKEKVTK